MNQTSEQKMKKPLFLLAIVLVLFYFVTLAVILKAKPIKGVTLMEKSWSENVIIRNGKAVEPVFTADYLIPQNGTYHFDAEWDVLDPGFITGLVGKDSTGKVLFAFTAAQITYQNECAAKEGPLKFEFHVLADENEYREFANTYELFSNEKDLNAMIEGIDYASFSTDGEWPLRLSLSVHEMHSPSKASYYYHIPIGLVTIILLFILYGMDQPSFASLKEGMDNIGIRYTIMSVLIVFAQTTVIILLSFHARDFATSLGENLSFLLMILGVDLVGFPAISLLCRNIPKTPIPKRTLGFGNLLLFILMSAGLAGAGMIVGNLFHNMVTLPFNNHTNALSELMMNSGFPMRVLTVAILAPIFEELIFRKILIDRMSKFGEFAAILTSGLMFGLFHGNFSQFFYTAAFGSLWAFIYVRTGKVIYTIICHMVINMSTSAVTVFLLRKLGEFVADPSDQNTLIAAMSQSEEASLYITLYSVWSILLTVVCVAGFIIFLVFFFTGKLRLRIREGGATHDEVLRAFVKSKYMWLFFFACIGLFLMNYLPGIIAYYRSIN